MRSRTGAVILLIIIVLVGFSFYRGYLILSSRQQPATNQTGIKLIIDQDKVKSDAKQAEQEVDKATRNIDLNPSS